MCFNLKWWIWCKNIFSREKTRIFEILRIYKVFTQIRHRLYKLLLFASSSKKSKKKWTRATLVQIFIRISIENVLIHSWYGISTYFKEIFLCIFFSGIFTCFPVTSRKFDSHWKKEKKESLTRLHIECEQILVFMTQ